MDEISSFLVSKWYLDCIADNGDGAIVYVAELRWKSWQMRYASTLRFFQDKVESAASIRKCSLPESAPGQVRLSLPHLGIEGTWKGFADPVERTIFEDRNGTIVWTCLQPASHVELSVDESKKVAGLGYAELVKISIPPWNLPLSELHWGRFISESDSLVWIDWRGKHSYRLVVHNGTERETALISPEEIRSADSRLKLTLDRGLVLRSGILGDTVFPAIASLAGALPAKMLGVHESKWRSKGVFHDAERSADAWAIHEVVKWGRQ